MSAPGERLPHVDEHSTTVEASPAATWEVLLRVIEASFGSERTTRFARLLGCADAAAEGPQPLATGSAIPGFHVAAAQPAEELALLGSHRFSDYALIFRLDPAGSGTRLRAETRAEFPGLRGGVYRTLVIRSRVHVLVTRRLLAAVKRRAEGA
jgi:hypothetical protein